MLRQLTLTNFRAFDDPVALTFRPITVLIGRNSSGKSSVIKSLLMLQQSGPGSPQFLTPDGDRVNLGPFPRLKNALSRKRTLTVQVSATTEFAPIQLSLQNILGVVSDFQPEDFLFTAVAKVPYGKNKTAGKAIYRLENTVTGDVPLRSTPEAFAGPTMWAVPLLPERLQRPPVLPDDDLAPDEQAQHLKDIDDLQSYLMGFFVVNTLRQQLLALRHISPVRDEFQRVIITSPPRSDSVGQRGEYTLPHLQRLMTEERADYEFLLPHLANVTGLDGFHFSTSGFVSQSFAKDKLTGADIPVVDYGFGVSQCLPIFVQGVLMEPYTTMMVEQPEAQLHPTAQLAMGSYFADLWKTRKVGTILETHSANILLRLRHLIAKGELSHEDVAVAFFTTDDENESVRFIKTLGISEDGSLEPGLPLEFFGADVIEGLELGAGA